MALYTLNTARILKCDWPMLVNCARNVLVLNCRKLSPTCTKILRIISLWHDVVALEYFCAANFLYFLQQENLRGEKGKIQIEVIFRGTCVHTQVQLIDILRFKECEMFLCYRIENYRCLPLRIFIIDLYVWHVYDYFTANFIFFLEEKALRYDYFL